ncbi:class I SAM-dependent methyltransferase [Marinomonas sp. THO17]|uniref:class I SAM-dependent methyltransferase n=1 Tax=Marinomonas sp. THO17 TaxID=3149048 RepID=UPI00336C03E6
MNLKVWIKSHIADRVLSPLRRELIELIDEGSSLLEVGCGTGDLLFQLADKIGSGYGVDTDSGMIEYAELKRKQNAVKHLSFECIDALEIAPRQFDFAVSVLCLHELPKQKACDLLKCMMERSKVVLVADYTEAKSLLGKVSMELDELISGHYRHYKNYRQSGEISSYVEEVGGIVQQEMASAIEGISIWRILAREHHEA